MSEQLAEIRSQALQLPPLEREELAGELLHSLDGMPLTDVDRAWIEEAHRRDEELLSGKVQPIDGVNFFSDLRRELGCD